MVKLEISMFQMQRLEVETETLFMETCKQKDRWEKCIHMFLLNICVDVLTLQEHSERTMCKQGWQIK